MNVCLVDIMHKVRATSVRISAHFIHCGRSASKNNISTISKYNILHLE